jgi:hypothetical protein
MYKNQDIIEILGEYFKETNIRIDKNQTNNNVLRLLDIDTNVRLNLNWDYIDEIIDDGRINLSYPGYSYYIDNFFKGISEEQIYSFNNKKLTMYGYDLNQFTDRVIQGFYSNRYAEFIIEINDKYLNSDDRIDNICKNLIYSFNIDEVNVRIDNPSDTFKLLFMQNNIAGLKSGWENTISIHISNVSKTNIENILQQVLFLINQDFDFFVIGQRINYSSASYFNLIEKNNSHYSFKKAKHYETLSYYNAAKFFQNEIKFQYYYKVLEYYFNNKDILELIKFDGEKKRDRDLIYEFFNLPHLKNSILNIYEEDFFQENYQGNLDNCDDTKIRSVANKLYRFRNSLIHGGNLTRRLPSITYDVYSNYYNELEWWINVAEELAVLNILHYCYDDFLLYSQP